MKHVNLRVHRMFLRIHRMFLPVLVGLCMSVGAYTQQITVAGTVIDQTSLSVIGASVRVKGTTVGTVTDFDGNFSLSANQNDVLVVSFLGYETQEVNARAGHITIVLQEDTELLQEVVVLGYGASTRKQDLSASVGIVSNTEELVEHHRYRCHAH